MRLRLLFLQDVPPKYRGGEVSAVAGGYARNYLIPQGLAVPATAEHLKRVEKIKAAAEGRRVKEVGDMQSLAAALNGITVTLRARAGEGGLLYGSVTNMSIAEELARSTGQAVDRRAILLPKPIREVGSFPVRIRLHQDVIPTITVVVEAEGQRASGAERQQEATAAGALVEGEAKAQAGMEEEEPGAEELLEGPLGEEAQERDVHREDTAS